MNTVIRYLIALCLPALASVRLDAQRTPIDNMYAVFSDACVVMECDYSITMSENRITGKAVLQVQDGMYTVEGNGLEICCDGESLWTSDLSACESYIEPASPILFSEMESRFAVADVENTDKGWLYELRCEDADMVKKAVLLLSSDGVILDGRFELADGNVVDVKVDSMKSEEKKSVTSFRPQIEFGPEWVVTDLR